MNISLPSPLKKWVDRQVAIKGYKSPSQFVLDMLRREKALEAREIIDEKLLEALDSGPSMPLTTKEWDHIRSEGRRLARDRRKK